MLPDWYNIGTRPKQLSFTFNKDRQVEKIVDDSTTAPFEFDIKDSGKVVTIHSNSGSYKEVVKPLFSSLTKGSLFVTERYNVTCVRGGKLFDSDETVSI